MADIQSRGEIVCIRGAGDIATGVIQKFVRSGFRVLALELEQPTAIRRQVALSTAMLDGRMQVEDIQARRVKDCDGQFEQCWAKGVVPVLADPKGASIRRLKPAGVIDAILAKKNLDTYRLMAPVTIGLGPGFSAPEEVNAVIETMRGHSLGRMILNGQALPNTGRPGKIGGQGYLRVLYAPVTGTVRHCAKIGDWLKPGEPIFRVGETVAFAPFAGTLRGLIMEGMQVEKGLKIADIAPGKLEREECFGISDKARCIGEGALAAYLFLKASSRR